MPCIELCGGSDAAACTTRHPLDTSAAVWGGSDDLPAHCEAPTLLTLLASALGWASPSCPAAAVDELAFAGCRANAAEARDRRLCVCSWGGPSSHGLWALIRNSSCCMRLESAAERKLGERRPDCQANRWSTWPMCGKDLQVIALLLELA